MLIDSVHNSQHIGEVSETISLLKVANKSMMDWMHRIQEVPGTENSGEHAHHSMNSCQLVEYRQLGGSSQAIGVGLDLPAISEGCVFTII